MKQKLLFSIMGLGVASLLSSCVSSEPGQDLVPITQVKEQGKLKVNLASDADFKYETRSVNESSYTNTSNYNVKVVNTTNNNIMVDCKASELSAYLPKTLDIGSYRVEATYGTEHDASRDGFLMSGSTMVTIKAKDEKTVTVNCEPTCGKISVAFDAGMATYYSDYSVSFGGTAKLGAKTFAWAKTDTEPWYVALSESGETLNYTISLTAKEEYRHKSDDGSVQATGTVAGNFQLQRNKAHKLTIKPSYSPTTDGGMKLSITIDESTNDKEITYEVPVTWL